MSAGVTAPGRSGRTIVGSWNYSGDPSLSDRDMVRFLIGDTDESDPLVSDEEIDAALTSEGSVRGGASLCCEHLARYFSREADKTVDNGNGGGTITHSLSQRAKGFAAAAVALRARANILAVPYAGGISVPDKDDRNADTDRVMPSFRRGMLDHPQADGPVDPTTWEDNP